MTLNSILEIEHKYINDQDERGLLMAEQLYQQSGAPSEPRALSGVLEKILLRLQSEGVPYPKILLLRRKQLQRKEWQPRVTASSPQNNMHANTRERHSLTQAGTPEGARQMIRDLQRQGAPGEEIARWEEELKRREELREAGEARKEARTISS